MSYIVSQTGPTSASTKMPGAMMVDVEDDFLFVDNDDLSTSDEESSDDEEEDDQEEEHDDDDDEESAGSDDSDESLSHGGEAEELFTARAGMAKMLSTKSLNALLNDTGNGRRQRSRGGVAVSVAAGGGGAPTPRLMGSRSMVDLLQMKMQLAMENQAAQGPVQGVVTMGHVRRMDSEEDAVEEEVDDSILKPDDYLATLIGGPSQLFAYDSLEGFFLPVKPEYVQAWTIELTRVIRDQDLDALKSMHRQGMRLQACSQFGESVVHLTVRRGTPEMLRFLLQDASVCMRVCCDYGRTPLHDAAWSLASTTGSFEKMELLLGESPMQLYITDKRGFTPLSYVPRNRWKECNAFLDRQFAKGRLFRMGAGAKAAPAAARK
jgi:Ankyrin repeats (3 copies)